MVKEFAKEIVAKRIAVEEVVVKGRVSHDVVGKEEERSGRGSLLETIGREVSFKGDLIILIKLGQEDQGEESYGKG